MHTVLILYTLCLVTFFQVRVGNIREFVGYLEYYEEPLHVPWIRNTVIAVVVVVALLAILIPVGVVLWKRRKQQQHEEEQEGNLYSKPRAA